MSSTWGRSVGSAVVAKARTDSIMWRTLRDTRSGRGLAGGEEGDDSVFEGVPEEDVVGSYPAEDRTFDCVRND